MAYVIKNGKTNLQQEAHIHQPTAWPVPHACTQPFHTGSGSHGQLYRPYWGSSDDKTVGSMDGRNPCLKDPLAAEASEKHSLKRQLHTQAVDWRMYAPCFN